MNEAKFVENVLLSNDFNAFKSRGQAVSRISQNLGYVIKIRQNLVIVFSKCPFTPVEYATTTRK